MMQQRHATRFEPAFNPADGTTESLSILAHKLRTPVTSLAMALGMMERTGFDAELLRIALAEVSRLTKLIEDLGGKNETDPAG